MPNSFTKVIKKLLKGLSLRLINKADAKILVRVFFSWLFMMQKLRQYRL